MIIAAITKNWLIVVEQNWWMIPLFVLFMAFLAGGKRGEALAKKLVTAVLMCAVVFAIAAYGLFIAMGNR